MTEKDIKSELPFLRNGIEQVALIVKDLDKTMETWWKMFGVGPWHVYTYGKPLVKKMTYGGKPAEYKMRIALAQLSPSMRIELIEMLEGETIYADFVEEHGYGLHHVAVLVDDMQAAIGEAEAAGIPVIQDGQGFGLDGDGHYAYLGTEERIGTILELVEVPKRRVAPERIYPPPDED